MTRASRRRAALGVLPVVAGASGWLLVAGKTDELQALLAFLIAAAAVGAIFQRQILEWFWAPELKVTIEARPPDCLKTESFGQPEPHEEGGLATPIVTTYYYRLRVTNHGELGARDVEAHLARVERRQGDGWVDVERFTPQWLLWTGIRTGGQSTSGPRGLYLPTLPPDGSRHLDLAFVRGPRAQSDFIDQVPGTPADLAVLILDLEPRYLRRGHVLERPGTYRFTLEIDGSNVASRRFQFVVEHSGAWYTRENEMLERGIVPHPVVAIR